MDPLGICFVGTYPPTHCGLATFGANLRNAMEPSSSGVIRVLDEPEPPNQPEVVAEWYWGDRVARNAALAEMKAYDIAILQHEYGSYGGEDGEDVVGFVRASPIPVIVVLHTVLSDPSPHQRLVLEELMEAADVLVTMTDAARRRLARGPAQHRRSAHHPSRRTGRPHVGTDRARQGAGVRRRVDGVPERPGSRPRLRDRRTDPPQGAPPPG